jgi:hypothetical protein
MIQQEKDWCTKITDVQTRWLRVPLDRPIADSTDKLKAIDLRVCRKIAFSILTPREVPSA